MEAIRTDKTLGDSSEEQPGYLQEAPQEEKVAHGVGSKVAPVVGGRDGVFEDAVDLVECVAEVAGGGRLWWREWR